MKKLFTNLFSLTLALLLTVSLALPATAATDVKKVTGFQSYNVDDDELSLKWNKVSNAHAYQVYYLKSGNWKYVGTTKKLKCNFDDLSSARQYKFKVRAYKLNGNKKVYGPFSNVLTVTTNPDEVENLKATAKTKNSVTLKWSKESRVTGYQVYVYSSSKGKYVKKASVKETKVTLKDLKANTTYKYKVRAYLKTDSKVYYGEFSDVLTVKTNASSNSSNATPNAELITSSKAVSVALNHANLKKSQVYDLSCELDYENGLKVYEVEFEYGKYEYSYHINAENGKVVRVEKEYR